MGSSIDAVGGVWPPYRLAPQQHVQKKGGDTFLLTSSSWADVCPVTPEDSLGLQLPLLQLGMTCSVPKAHLTASAGYGRVQLRKSASESVTRGGGGGGEGLSCKLAPGVCHVSNSACRIEKPLPICTITALMVAPCLQSKDEVMPKAPPMQLSQSLWSPVACGVILILSGWLYYFDLSLSAHMQH